MTIISKERVNAALAQRPDIDVENGKLSMSPSQALVVSHHPLDEEDGGLEEESSAADAAWLFSGACLRCGEAMSQACGACGSLVAGLLLLCRALVACAQAAARGPGMLLQAIVMVISSCRLPAPPPADEEGVLELLEPTPNSPEWTLVISLSVTAFVALVWDLHHGGLSLAAWVPMGALSGALGAAIGMAVAGLATPSADETAYGETSSGNVDLAELTDGKMWGDLTVVGWSLGAAAALSAAASGLVAWSVHEYPGWARARALTILDVALLLLFAVRNGHKAWRSGGCTRSGRLKLIVSGNDCSWLRRCGCGWSALL
jgi:hypothetical protein